MLIVRGPGEGGELTSLVLFLDGEVSPASILKQWDRFMELEYRDLYNRERALQVDFDGVSWPIDLGEAGA